MQYGLIGAGPVNQYLAGKLPRLSQDLGPVAATNHRLASRIVNTLRAGEALRDLRGLADTSLILICAPAGHFETLLPVLERSPLDWSGKSLVLCDCNAVSSDLNVFRGQGARVASMQRIPGLPSRFVIEGDHEASRAARAIVHELRGAAIEIQSGNYPVYRAALTFASSLFTPVLEGAMSSIREAGISGAARPQILEALFLQTLREYLYSGRRSWDGTVAEGNRHRMEEEIQSLQKCHPELVDLYRSTADSAERLFGKPRRAGVRKRIPGTS